MLFIFLPIDTDEPQNDLLCPSYVYKSSLRYNTCLAFKPSYTFCHAGLLYHAAVLFPKQRSVQHHQATLAALANNKARGNSPSVRCNKQKNHLKSGCCPLIRHSKDTSLQLSKNLLLYRFFFRTTDDHILKKITFNATQCPQSKLSRVSEKDNLVRYKTHSYVATSFSKTF